MAKAFTEERKGWMNDKEFNAEMNRRFTEMQSGKIKGLTLEELEASARQAYKNKTKKKK